MAELTAKGRKQLSGQSFCGPDRSYPAHDASHARNCISRAAQQLKRGNLTQAQHDKIVACCRKKLGQKRSIGYVDPESLAWALEVGQRHYFAELGVLDMVDNLDPENRSWPIPTEEMEHRADFREHLPAPAVIEEIAQAIEERGSSAALPGLDKSPGENWIDRLPKALGAAFKRSWIYRAAKHLHWEKGMTVGRAIATAINAAKRGCATGDLNWPGPQSVNPKSRAEMCAAVALWNTMKATA